MKSAASFIAISLVFAAPVATRAQDAPADNTKAEKAADYEPQVHTTKLSGTFGGQRVNYAATIGETILKNKDGVAEAAIVTTAYVREPRDPSRPVTFLFNGGPGSGTVWLMMGAFGPKRVAIPSDARDDGAPPYPIVDNPDALLDVTDVVFIDPPGTGFSHLIGKANPEDYYGVTQDAKAVAEVIRRWLNDNGRWNSPKFLGGESYGTTRSAAVANQLMNETYNDVALNGIILISTVLDFAAGADTPGNELSYITNLPSMAATAQFHGKAGGGASVEAFVEEARQWAIGPYASALLKGQKLQGEERAAIRRDLARFTGLSETYLESADLRVTPNRFYKELLRDRGLTVGRLDSRYTGKDYDSAGEGPDNDPSFYGIDASYTAAINSWSRDTLGFKTDREYQSIGRIGGQWDWRIGGRDSNAYLNVAPYIGQALRENSGLRVFVGQGYYDFATPFFAAEYALSRTGIPQDRVEYQYYGAGHMMYIRDEDRHKLSADIRAFIRGR
ncbi:S10 family peptidase [Sphingopyxis macrogoltabida]|uniref:Peptidase S10 n=1 Tax=Sphingopyxis macrogoltabida TaxID=33050 RepID=A0AAC8YYP6_SPHMC|nr:peptidase S10 [Sphingopyxis macrogoltabida]ALJ12230.1 peptidase S10 [Sphingopyxis macrogoltabida]AMU88404.1 peptidase S10 [Sphingopyxis macrogoltabida]